VLTLSILALALIVGGINPRFLAQKNITDILNNASYIAVAALGMSLVIISVDIDISVGAQVSLIASIGGLLAINGADPIVTYTVPILANVFVGAVNGFLVAFLRVPAILATLAMTSILRGLLILWTGGDVLYNLPDWFKLAQQRVFDIPIPIIIMVVLVIIMAWYMRYTAQGRAIYAIGGNKEAARLSGINERMVIMRVFLINGLMVGIAGMMFATQYNVIQATALTGVELLVITSSVVGGVSILGGMGTVIGAALGAVLMHVIPSAMNLANISVYWQQAVQGVLILFTVLVDIFRRRRQYYSGKV